MDQFLPSWLDVLLRRHPVLMFACVLAAAVVISLLLISHPTRDVVLYAGF